MTAEQQQPWPRAQRMPLAVVGGRPQPWHYQAIAEYGAATGTELEPNPTIPGGYTATQVNWAITWWNERVEAEQQQDDGEVREWLTYMAETIDNEEDSRICSVIHALLDQRTALAARVVELESERDEAWTDWTVSVLFVGGAISVDYEDETDARLRYQALLADRSRADRLVANSSYTTGRAIRIELMSRTNVQGVFRMVESAALDATETEES